MHPRLAKIKRNTTVDEVHEMLMEIAAEKANEDPQVPRDIFPAGEIFWPTAEYSTKGGFCISWDPFVTTRMEQPERDRLNYTMAQIGRRAIFNTLKENAQVVTGLIIGEARQGRDYLARFR